MTKLLHVLSLSFLVLVTAVQPARADEGNGQGSAFLTATPFRIGNMATVTWGSPGMPFAQMALVISDNLGPSTFPGIGSLCLDINSPGFTILTTGILDATGQASLTAAIPNIPSLVTFPPSYLMAVIVDFTIPAPFVSIPKTIAVRFENSDSYTPPTAALGSPRALHTATTTSTSPLSNRTRVFIAGGGNGTILSPVATDTTEIFNPLTRTTTPGPNMNVARALHQSVLLDDGRVLVIGGVDTFGNCTATCQFYDPATGMLSAAPSMGNVRAGHVATKMANGRVLVTGGVTTFVGGQTNLPAVLNTAQLSGEVFDPIANNWTAVSNTMSARRFGHAQVLLNNGMVLVSGGINGGTTILGTGVPTYTATCNTYNPATNAFGTTGNLSGARAGHAMSLLPNGNVLATGGIVSGLLSIPTANNVCQVFNGATWTTSGVAPLPAGIALHTQVTHPVSGAAIVQGGLTGTFLAIGTTANAGVHNGSTYSALAGIGLNPGLPGSMTSPRGSHTVTPLYDGSFVVLGGTDGTNVYSNGYVYTPNP